MAKSQAHEEHAPGDAPTTFHCERLDGWLPEHCCVDRQRIARDLAPLRPPMRGSGRRSPPHDAKQWHCRDCEQGLAIARQRGEAFASAALVSKPKQAHALKSAQPKLTLTPQDFVDRFNGKGNGLIIDLAIEHGGWHLRQRLHSNPGLYASLVPRLLNTGKTSEELLPGLAFAYLGRKEVELICGGEVGDYAPARLTINETDLLVSVAVRVREIEASLLKVQRMTAALAEEKHLFLGDPETCGRTLNQQVRAAHETACALFEGLEHKADRAGRKLGAKGKGAPKPSGAKLAKWHITEACRLLANAGLGKGRTLLALKAVEAVPASADIELVRTALKAKTQGGQDPRAG
jgi:hypothetical protein